MLNKAFVNDMLLLMLEVSCSA